MKEKLNIEVGERIRLTRELMSLSQESFSELCDISSRFLSDIECGNKSLTTKTLYKICRAGNVSADYLMFGTKENTTNVSVMLEILSNLDPRYISSALNILSEFAQAIRTSSALRFEDEAAPDKLKH